jgi:HEPN domain-containing protein
VNDYAEAKTWINLAERDYAVASHLNETFLPLPVEIICFHCQQAVEKALKAILAYYEDSIPKIHDISVLLQLCKAHTDEIHIDEKISETVTNFAVMTRYTEDRRDFTEDTAEFALKQAKQALEMVKQALDKAQKEAAQNIEAVEDENEQ